MEAVEQTTAHALRNYLGQLGLKGHCWLVGSHNHSLAPALAGLFPDSLHATIPEDANTLHDCSVLIIGSDENAPGEAVIEQLTSSAARPLIILLGDTAGSRNSCRDRLHALGYHNAPDQPGEHLFQVLDHADQGHKKHFDVARYWENRYASGRDSGSGSYGRLARFKAQFLNDFVRKNAIRSVLEFGCGDGAQLSLGDYPEYTGLDISPTVIELCRRTFAHDSTKQFEVYDPERFKPDLVQAELGLSLDVIYHLSNDEVYRSYLDHLFSSASRFVVIYSNSEQGSRTGVNESAGYVRFRNVLADIAQWQPEWSLVSATPNRFPFSTLNPSNTSFADFFVFEKRREDSADDLPPALQEFSAQKIINTLMVSDENTKLLFNDIVTTNKKLDALARQIQSLDNAQHLQTRLDASDAKYGEACQQIAKLKEQLSTADAKQQETERLHRAANAKYREACQQITTLKSSQTYKAGSYVRAASGSVIDAVKLPLRLWRLRNHRQKNPAIQQTNLLQGLRYIKWKVVVPAANALGIRHSKVAHLTLPDSVRPFISPTDRKQASLPPAPPRQQPEIFTPPSPAAQEVSILGWPAPPDNGKPLVLAVMDEFTEGCFGSDVRLLQPRPDNWYGLARKYPPALLFIESAWKGNGGSWQYRVGTYNIKPGRELEHMAAWARQENIPSVFWNKEDPVHHDKFMEAAALADHIFTTDQNMVDSYKQRTGNQSVHALPFAAQPALHKPAPLAGRLNKSCFAGSWYGNRHAERGEAMKWLLKTANKHGLEIFDRNHGTGNFPFPEEYQAGIRGSLPYLELCKEYPRYRVFLNVNSVTDSPTMFSRRVFELMACGTPVVSTYARGIEELFDSDAVWLVRSEAEADEAIHTLLNDDAEWRRRSLAGIREVFSRHTYAHRFNTVFETIGLNERIETTPNLLLFARADSTAELGRLSAFVDAQRYKHFELLIECPSGTNAPKLPQQAQLITSDALQKRAVESNATAMGWISPQHTYGPYYLQDLTNAMAYQPDASGWAKACAEDAFTFGTESLLAASIWQPEQFRQQWLTADDQTVGSAGLYCTDTDEFTPGTQATTTGRAQHD